LFEIQFCSVVLTEIVTVLKYGCKRFLGLDNLRQFESLTLRNLAADPDRNKSQKDAKLNAEYNAQVNLNEKIAE
jgi:hypothetical protein